AAVAGRVGAEPSEILFTSGATEANNLALKGVLAAAPPGRRGLVTTRIEHKSVLDAAAALEARGLEVSYVECDSIGIVRVERIVEAISPSTALASVMHANNETGMIQPLAEIAEACRARGVLLHVDAAQSVGKIPLALGQSGIDLCSLTAHKLGGPKGIG